MEDSRLTCAIYLMMVVICSCIKFSFSDAQNLTTDIQQLASALPGCYSNAKQYYAYSMKSTPHQKRRLFMLRAEFYRMESPLFNDSLTIYFQDFIKSSKVPFTSGFYSFTPDPETNTIRMKVYKFKEAVPGLKISYTNYSIPGGSVTAQKLTEAFHNARLKTQTSCDMLWKRVSDRTFMGVTRSVCLATLGKDNVRISVSMTLTSSRITLTEGWYNIDDRTRLRELKIPYVLKRKSSHPVRSSTKTQSKPISTYKSRFSLKVKEKGLRENLSTYHKLRTNKRRSYSKKIEARSAVKALPSYRNSKPRRKAKSNTRKRRNLRNFRQVKSSLMAGRSVFYKVDLSGCAMPSQVQINRLSFGGQIMQFQVLLEKSSSRRRTKIYFSASRTSMSYRGVESIQRELTLHRGGRVEVKVTKRFADPMKLQKQYTFQCRLCSKKKRWGSVKIFTYHSSRPREAKSLSKMTRSLNQGHDLWLVADVSKCQGGDGQDTVTIGSTVSDFDLVNNENTLEVFIPLDQINPRFPQKSHLSGFVIQIFENGEVILTWVNGSSEDNDLKQKFSFGSAYHCELSNRLSSHSNEAGTGSVTVFYR